jgi:hypothetical protein
MVAEGYVTDASSKQFEASYTQFSTGATKMTQGLAGMGQYLDAISDDSCHKVKFVHFDTELNFLHKGTTRVNR